MTTSGYTNSSTYNIGTNSNPSVYIGGSTFSTVTFTESSGTVKLSCPQHRTESDNVEYLDGLVISYCAVCGDRIEITRLPGGFNAVHARELAQRLVVAAGSGEVSGEDLEELSALVRQIKEEKMVLGEISDLLDVVRNLL